MTIGDRIEKRRIEIGIPSQSELARRAKMGQSTLNGLINKPYRWSPSLPKLARELQTTVEYLAGETDDPNEGAPLPAPQPEVRFVTMQVALPPESALAEMFDALLAGIIPATPAAERAEQARQLAELLPIGLSRLQDLRPAPRRAPRELATAGDRTPAATPPRAPRR